MLLGEPGDRGPRDSERKGILLSYLKGKTILTYFLHNQLRYRRMSFFPSRGNVMATISKARACPQIFREAALTFQIFVKYHRTPPTSSPRIEAVPSRALYHQDEVICEGADTTAEAAGTTPLGAGGCPGRHHLPLRVL